MILSLSFLVSLFLVFFGTEAVSYGISSSLTQCANDPDNSGLIEMCQWITGALVTNNSLYAESDGVPQRWLFEYNSGATAQEHTATFQYTFTKGSVYAYDFLNSVDHSMPLSLINPCGDLPPFANPDDCVNAFMSGVAANGSLIPLPSDPFDAVSLREHPPVRYLHFGCIKEGTSSAGCDVSNVTIDTPVHIPNTNCFQNCGDSDAQVTVHFWTNGNSANNLIGMWFSAQLADSQDPDGAGPAIGWGTGYGAASAAGSSFHVKLISIDGNAVGGEDDQINSDVISAGHQTDLAVTKSCPGSIHAGNNVSYTITVKNNGPETATGVYIDDTLPLQTGVTFVSATPSQGTCNALVGNILHCDIGFMQPQNTVTVTVVVNVASTFSGTNITDSVTVGGPATDSVPGNNTASCTTDISPPVGTEIDLSVNKTCPSGYVAGTAPTDLEYDITVTNNDSTFTATGVTLTDALPAGVTFVSASPSQGTCSQSGGVVTCDLNNISAGGNATVTIHVNAPANPSFRGDLTDVATVSADQSDPVTSNNSKSCTTTVTGQTDISIIKSCPANATEGDLITYDIAVHNAGPSTSLDTHIQDILPNSSGTLLVSFVSATPDQGSCTFVNPDIVHCTLGDIAPGGTVHVAIIVQATTAGILLNTAESHIHPPDEDTNHSNDTPSDGCGIGACECDTTVSGSPPALPDLQVTKHDSPDPAAAGGNLTYTINVTNSGGANETGVTLTDTLPPGVTFVSASAVYSQTNTSLGNVCNYNGVTRQVTCSLGTLASGAPNATNPIIVTIVVTVNSSTPGGTVLTNKAVVAGNETESDAGPPDTNNTATITTNVNAEVGLYILKSGSPDPVITGNNLTYKIVAGNVGPSDATNVTVVDTLPSGVGGTYFSASSTQGSCSGPPPTVTCNLGTISAGGSATIMITVSVNISLSVGTSATITNYAKITSTEDPGGVDTQTGTTVDNPASVPTLSEWGIMILMLLTGLTAVFYLRRRRKV